MVSLEEVLNAPLLPENLPKFEIIKECEKVEEEHSSNSEDDSESESEIETESEIEEVFPCDCGFDEYSSNLDNQACGATANCINRELFIECNTDECPCRERCQNRRFQKRQYVKVKVIETPGKGFGLFTCEDLKPGTLVMEYVGEIVTQEQMNERARKYFAQGQPHFYFMTLRPNQIIDATCKGNLSRFLNHSCSPNCETQKWIVKGKIKIGLFTLKSVKAGTELTFDYKFVRFGKEPQKCLCGESNCTGFIGVSSENEKQGGKRRQRAVEIEDVDEFEVFMESDPKSAELPSEISIIVTKLIQTDDLEIVKKLLKILESSEKYLCKRKFLNLHGLKLLATLFTEHLKDSEIIWSILKILKGLPLGTRNLIEDSGWFDKLKMIKNDSEFERIVGELEDQWNQLEMAFKIPKKSELKEMSSGQSTPNRSPSVLMSVPSEFSSALKRKRQWSLDKDEDEEIDMRNRESRDLSSSPHESKSRSHESKSHSRESQSISRSRSPAKRIPDPMWLSAAAPDGKIYYYHAVTRETSWDLPMIEAKETREREIDRGQDEYRRRDDYRIARDYNRDNRDGRYRDYKKDSRDYKDHRDTQSYRDTQSHRDHRDRDTQSYREGQSHRDTHTSHTSHSTQSSHTSHSIHKANTEESRNSALLEGVGDSSQLAAIIERAKARRSQFEEGEVESIVTTLTIEDDVSSPTDPKSSNNQSKKYYAKLKEEISSVVIKFFSHYRQELGDDFKELARKYTHKIIDKEGSGSGSGGDSNDPVLTSKKKQKIKIYLAEVIKGRKIKLLPEHEY